MGPVKKTVLNMPSVLGQVLDVHQVSSMDSLEIQNPAVIVHRVRLVAEALPTGKKFHFFFSGICDMAYSAWAVMVKLGLTPIVP